MIIMDIERALRLKKGDIVHCPADRGEPAYIGKVVDNFTCKDVHTNMYGTKYIWVLVQGLLHKTTWPSNRLG
jgi:hypothetical protein